MIVCGRIKNIHKSTLREINSSLYDIENRNSDHGVIYVDCLLICKKKNSLKFKNTSCFKDLYNLNIVDANMSVGFMFITFYQTISWDYQFCYGDIIHLIPLTKHNKYHRSQ